MSEPDKLKIFISYSRDDLKFADQLDAALDLTGFECTIDRHGISGGEDWRERLGNLILESDTVVFVLSPTSAVSKICEWEVEEAGRLGKRILPVLCRPLEGAEPPVRLRDLNYVYFYDEPKAPGSGFGAGLAALVEALKTDLDWLREHTRLLERASEWVAGGRQETALLFGTSIAEAKRWAERRPRSAPEVTSTHIEFIRASEEAEARRQDAEHQRLKAIAAAQEERAGAIADREAAQKREIEASRTMVRRTKIGIVVVSLLAVLASAVGFYAYQQRDVALKQTEQAKSHLERAAQTSSLFRASQARSALERNDVLAAAEVALSGVPDVKSPLEFERNRPFYPEAFEALHRAWSGLRELAVLTGHSSTVRAAAVASDGSYLVTVSDDNSARVWDERGTPLRVLLGHDSPLTSVAVAPDGSAIAVGSQDLTATVWGRDGTFMARLGGHRGGVTSVAFSPDGTRVLTTSRDREAKIWDLAGTAVATLAGHGGVVTSGAFSPDGQRILTASEDGTAAIWDLDGGMLRRLEGHTGPVVRAVYDAAGNTIATASVDGTARLWSGEGEPAATLAEHKDALTSIAFSQDGKHLVTGGRDKLAILWEVSDRTSTVLAGHEGAVLWVAFSPDGARVITGGADAKARVWSGDELAVELAGHEDAVTWAALSDAGFAVTLSADQTIRLWAVDGRMGTALEAGVAVAELSAGGTRVLTVDEANAAALWDLEGKKLRELQSSTTTSRMVGITVSRDGQRALTHDADGVITVTDHEGKVLGTFRDPETLVGEDDQTREVLLSPDGTKVLARHETEAVVWSLQGSKLATVPFTGVMDTIAFTSDGARIVTADSGGTISLWGSDGTMSFQSAERANPDLTVVAPGGDRALQSWPGQGEDRGGSSAIVELREQAGESVKLGYRVTSAVFTPDGGLIFAVLGDGSGRLIDKSGNEISNVHPSFTLEGAIGISVNGTRIAAKSTSGRVLVFDRAGQHVLSFGHGNEEIDEAGLSPNGKVMLTRTGGEARIWPTYERTQDLVDEVKAELPRCLGTDARRQFYLPESAEDWCRKKYPVFKGEAAKVGVSRAPSAGGLRGPEVDFAYYPPGDLAHPETGQGRADRFVYLPDIAFPLKLGPGQHAHMNSQIWGFGGGGWGGKEAAGGSECDPRNYDSMRQRDTYCEVRSWAMGFCPGGKGKQGVSIRPPTCEGNRWEVVAAADGQIISVTTNPTVTLKGTDGTTYQYLHMVPASIRVKDGDQVKKGDVLGRVGNYMTGKSNVTTIQLGFQARQRISVGGREIEAYVPVYASLIAAYRELKGLPRGIDANGNLIVDPDFEIGAGKIPRPPE